MRWRPASCSRYVARGTRYVTHSHSGPGDIPERRRESVRREIQASKSSLGISVDPDPLSVEERRRLNDNPDPEFYQDPCLAYHVDAAFRERLTEVYAEELTPGSTVLDLCSSVHSHLPPSSLLPIDQVIGHGMNDAELLANPRLDRHFLMDINAAGKHVQLPLSNAEVDAVLCCCGIQYLVQPLEVLRECIRVLRPAGTIVISFSSHSFEQKAYAGWLDRDMVQRQRLVERYLQLAGFVGIRTEARIPPGGDIDAPHPLSDPFMAVIARRPKIPASKDVSEAEQQQGDGVAGRAAGAFSVALARWVSAFNALQQEALQMGIPKSALPVLPDYPTKEEVQAAHKLLSAIIASFMSAEL
eukprot:jgi/Tetstr1/438639/TSEL_027190.t1